MAKYFVAKVGELKPGEMKSVTAGETAILLANVKGTYYAIGDVCPHMGCRLSGGLMVEDNIVECPCHGSRFNLIDGFVMKGPAVKNARVYEVLVDGDDVFVEA